MMFGRWLPSALIAGVCLGVLASAPHAAAATLTPASLTVVAGSSFTLTLNDTIDPSSNVAVVDLSVTFDHSLLTFVAAEKGALLTDAGWDGDSLVNFLSGRISFSEGVDGNDAAGTENSVTKLTFDVSATAPAGPVTVSVKSNALDQNGAPIPYEYQLAPISDTITIAAAVPPTTVPEPATIALLLAPALAVASLKRRNRC